MIWIWLFIVDNIFSFFLFCNGHLSSIGTLASCPYFASLPYLMSSQGEREQNWFYLFNSWQYRIKMLTDFKQNLFFSTPQAPRPRAAPQHLVLPIPQQPLTTWDPAPYMASLPNFTASIALHAVNLLATSLCPPWLTRPPQPPRLLRLSPATQLGAPTPHRFFPPSCTPHLLLPVPVQKVQSHLDPPCCSGCSRQKSWELHCCPLPRHHHRHLPL